MPSLRWALRRDERAAAIPGQPLLCPICEFSRGFVCAERNPPPSPHSASWFVFCMISACCAAWPASLVLPGPLLERALSGQRPPAVPCARHAMCCPPKFFFCPPLLVPERTHLGACPCMHQRMPPPTSTLFFEPHTTSARPAPPCRGGPSRTAPGACRLLVRTTRRRRQGIDNYLAVDGGEDREQVLRSLSSHSRGWLHF